MRMEMQFQSVQDPAVQASDSSVLIVDCDDNMRTGLRKSLARRFGSVFSAEGDSDAALILDEQRISAVVCGHELGIDRVSGVELVSQWRDKYPSISYAVILTGADSPAIPACTHVDKVISKAGGVSKIIDELFI